MCQFINWCRNYLRLVTNTRTYADNCNFVCPLTIFDHILCDIIEKYVIKNKDLWIQKDNGSSLYKNKLSFVLLQELADKFGPQIVRTYGFAGHGKGAIDKNFLKKKDIVTRDLSKRDS